MDAFSKRVLGISLLAALVLSMQALAWPRLSRLDPPLTNWKAPSTYSPSQGKRHGMTTQALLYAVPFIPLDPCRAYDSRPSAGGPGPLPNATPLTVALTGGGCGVLSSGVVAVSVNITIFNISGATGNGVFRVDTAAPPAVAWINYPPTETQRANAGAVAVDSSSQIVVQVNQGAGSVDFTIDVNGFYASDTLSGSANLYPFLFKTENTGTFGAMRVENYANSTNVYGLTARTTSTGNGSAAVFGLSRGATGQTIGVLGDNDSTSGFAMGVLGRINSTMAGGLSAGVRGISNGTGGNGVGVWGSHAGDGWGVYGSAADGRGVYGAASSTSGVSYGVYGLSASASYPSAGVYGVDMGGDPENAGPFLTSGVRGASAFGYGVHGSTQEGVGVKGHNLSSSGAFESAGYLGYTSSYGVYAVGDVGATGAKTFVEPHPVQPGKAIVYVALEGPEAGTYFRGRGTIQNGTGVISVPESFRLVSDEEGLTVQITPIGQVANVAVFSADLNSIVVHSSTKNLAFYYTVNGVRKAFKDWDPMGQSDYFVPEGPDDRMPLAYTPEQRRRLIANGTYNADGTVNMTTAEWAGWKKLWDDRKAEAEKRAANAAAARGTGVQQ